LKLYKITSSLTPLSQKIYIHKMGQLDTGKYNLQGHFRANSIEQDPPLRVYSRSSSQKLTRLIDRDISLPIQKGTPAALSWIT
jgi:hypothetical protein